MLRSIYLQTWALYAFGQATHDTIQATLKSHQLALRATAQYGAFPPELIAQIKNMALTLHALERPIDMDFSESIMVFGACPIEGYSKRCALEQIAALPNPRCIRHVADLCCSGVLYTEKTLADGTRKQTPTKQIPYDSLPHALSCLSSRSGVPDSMQPWRIPDDKPVDADRLDNGNIPPLAAQDWFDAMGPDRPFGTISEGCKWRTEATGLCRLLGGQELVEEATGEGPLSLTWMRLGLSLSLNMDG
ncbi:hypothetical protein FRC09_014817 [Ceratobasidium sp. 395]|nr:hypothetical protein FRC09_014817 [Ceratobasidium sp. 395]